MQDSSSQYFSVTDGFKAADDCRLGTSESCRKTPGGGLRILIDSVENGGLARCLRASRLRFVFEVRVSLCGQNESAVDGMMVVVSFLAAAADWD